MVIKSWIKILKKSIGKSNCRQLQLWITMEQSLIFRINLPHFLSLKLIKSSDSFVTQTNQTYYIIRVDGPIVQPERNTQFSSNIFLFNDQFLYYFALKIEIMWIKIMETSNIMYYAWILENNDCVWSRNKVCKWPVISASIKNFTVQILLISIHLSTANQSYE